MLGLADINRVAIAYARLFVIVNFLVLEANVANCLRSINYRYSLDNSFLYSRAFDGVISTCC